MNTPKRFVFIFLKILQIFKKIKTNPSSPSLRVQLSNRIENQDFTSFYSSVYC
jgi:hypothetical protein